MSKLQIKRAAVLGAGVMGAQIAAHLANAGVPVLLYDLAAREGDPNGIVLKALAGLRKLEPAPLASPASLDWITPANYDQHLEQLGGCDLVIEAIAERLDWKTELYHRVAPHIGDQAILASNTSGLSVGVLAQALPEKLRSRFCGVHFFNPPRYMKLVELVAPPETRPDVLDDLESWLTSHLGKGVIRALDTPNFIANRVGVFSMLAAMHHTVRLGLGFDEVDALTGPLIGRPKSATYRTADVVGLDTLAHVIDTLRDGATDDPWHAFFEVPGWLQQLIDQGALGQKTRRGVYRKEGRDILVLDLKQGEYRASTGQVADEVASILKQKDPAARLRDLRASTHPQAQFLWSVLRDTFHYSAYHLAGIADNARDLDLAMRWGFGWSLGPLETWQAAGWQAVAQAIREDIDHKASMATVPLPDWAVESDRRGVHVPQGSYAPRDGRLVAPSSLPVYTRQVFPERVLGGQDVVSPGQDIFWENEGVRLWRLPDIDAGVAILSFKSKMHTIGDEVLEGVLHAVAQAERDSDALVLWHEAPFAVGANLKQVSEAVAAGEFERLEQTVARFQQASLALHYAQVPVVAAAQGMALGGGCEFLMHASARVLALESYVGLVEAGVGLIPAGGGSKAFAVRAARLAAQTETPAEVFPYLQPAFRNIAMAQVSKSAWLAIEAGFGQPSDTVVFHPDELLWTALRRARAMADVGHRVPAHPRDIPVAGRSGIANFDMLLVNMREGGMISPHDYRVAHAAAVALCGGDVDTGSRVDEAWLLAVERREFMALLRTPETQARIRHTLDTGKPLRN
ncbi:3-hydroxyacyl-CoA dehydrogenase/enoyl-CoA hydratase family protein [Corticimicrobacter populi]|uniref:3-hydroxyacyl-CoA dehydrogenase n=1 Tax=Corticimicrobacter populi TaxID=2175229 RepID=A0A2V1JZ78_9BURK|nr:3-hydroxyacyl-CoA dehydrogenase/enoyl-CoA hydratase family protein [Corticimicrobacter populi]PWF24194.1 3-hydroxyacyl-CoA dehydrogenase [Corticimicrobacter populi]